MRSRILDSCFFSSWNPDSHEIPVILHIYIYIYVNGPSEWAGVMGNDLNETERPVITWVQKFGSYVSYLGGVT